MYFLSAFIIYPKVADNRRQEQNWKELFVIFLGIVARHIKQNKPNLYKMHKSSLLPFLISRLLPVYWTV